MSTSGSKRRLRVPCLLLGGDPINALGVMRTLGAIGVGAYYATGEKNAAYYSRYCKKSFVINELEGCTAAMESFLDCFQENISSEAVVIPLSDQACLSLAKIQSEIAPGLHPLIASEDSVITLVDHAEFYRSLSCTDIDYPRTQFVNPADGVENLVVTMKFPVYVRPALSQDFSIIFHRKGFVANSLQELMQVLPQVFDAGIEVMIQEIIPGTATEMSSICGYFDRSGRPLALFAYKRVREWPHGFGTSSLIESISLDLVQPILEKVLDYLKKLNYFGIFEAEIRWDQRDKKFKLVEINARSWSSSGFPGSCGSPLVEMAYFDCQGHASDKVKQGYTVGAKWIHAYNDLRSSWRLMRTGGLSLPSWIKSLRGIRSCAYFAGNDLFPGFVQSALMFRKGLARRVFNRLKNSVKTRRATATSP